VGAGGPSRQHRRPARCGVGRGAGGSQGRAGRAGGWAGGRRAGDSLQAARRHCGSRHLCRHRGGALTRPSHNGARRRPCQRAVGTVLHPPARRLQQARAAAPGGRRRRQHQGVPRCAQHRLLWQGPEGEGVRVCVGGGGIRGEGGRRLGTCGDGQPAALRHTRVCAAPRARARARPKGAPRPPPAARSPVLGGPAGSGARWGSSGAVPSARLPGRDVASCSRQQPCPLGQQPGRCAHLDQALGEGLLEARPEPGGHLRSIHLRPEPPRAQAQHLLGVGQADAGHQRVGNLWRGSGRVGWG
jgi:hypothetical protein